MLLCMDLGGTAVKLGLVDEEGNIHARGEADVRGDGYAMPIFHRAMEAARDFLARTGAQVRGVGISATGQIDSRTGVVIGTNLEGTDSLMEIINQCIAELKESGQLEEWNSYYTEYAKSLGIE